MYGTPGLEPGYMTVDAVMHFGIRPSTHFLNRSIVKCFILEKTCQVLEPVVWQELEESNLRPADLESAALPTELSP